MARTQVPEEDQRVQTTSELQSFRPRPKAVIRTEGEAAAADGLSNLYWWDPNGDPANADGKTVLQSNVPMYRPGEQREGVWRRVMTPIQEVTTDDVDEGSSLYYTESRVQTYLENQSYVTQSGAIDLSNNTTDDLPEGSGNQYFTAERAQDAAAQAIAAGSDISTNYDDANNSLTINSTVTASSIGLGRVDNVDQTISTNLPSGGQDGDVWFVI
jgi:hypothetical protein